MKFIKKLENFLQSDATESSYVYKPMLNYKRIWRLNFLLVACFSLIPLIFFAAIDYNVSRRSVELEANLRLSRFTSNAWRAISFFLDKHNAVLDFVVQDNTIEELNSPDRLAALLSNMKGQFGEFTDLSIIDANGVQKTYEGPYDLEGKDYSSQDWFKEVVQHGTYVSDVFLGYRNTPHFVIALKHKEKSGEFYIIRSTLENQFGDILSKLEIGERDDVFLINREGIIQTPSRFFGNVLEKMSLPIPVYSDNTSTLEITDTKGEPLLIGYRFIPNTPFVLMVVKQKNMLMSPWRTPRINLIEYLTASIIIVLFGIVVVISYMTSKLKVIDERRIRNLEMAQSADKMASIGRLAAGVAHELNNPLAVINEKAGLIQDMIEFKDAYKDDKRLIKTVESILYSVDRCRRITGRLLGFSRKMDVKIQAVNLKHLITDVLGFLEKEASYRSIDVSVNIPDNIPEIQSDQGKLQQVFLNIINNAFAALDNHGKLVIGAELREPKNVAVTVTDNGCGIKPADLKRIFEPFFSTKTQTGGTGLGLSITYGIVGELGGMIDVKSEVGKGTSFIITLPIDS